MTQISNILEKYKDSYLFINKDWHLRIEGGHGILFYYDPEWVIWHRLDQEQICALALMDGTRTIADICRILNYILNEDRRNSIKGIICSLLKKSDGKENPSSYIHFSKDKMDRDGVPIYNLKEILQRMEETTKEDFIQITKDRLTAPISLVLMPSYNCTTDCIYCYSERANIPVEEYMSLKRWLEIIDEAADLNVQLAVFSGGDPLTYPHILEILQRLIQRGFNFVLPTKTLVNKSTAKRMADLGMNKVWIQVSLDGIYPETLKQMVGVEDYAKRAFQSIKNILTSGLKLRVHCVATPLNYKEIPCLMLELYNIGVRKASITGYGRSYYRHNDSLFLDKEHIDYLNKKIDELKINLGRTDISCSIGLRDFTNCSQEERKKEWVNRSSCSGGRSSITITPAGKVTLCEQIPLREEYIVGDLKHKSIADIWKSERMLQMVYPPKELFKDSLCGTCQEYEDCHNIHGYCFRDSLFTYGTIYAPPPSCPYAPPGLRMM